jgi:hypothetical protein
MSGAGMHADIERAGRGRRKQFVNRIFSAVARNVCDIAPSDQ